MSHRQKILIIFALIAMANFLLVALFSDNGLFELHRKHEAYKTVLQDNARLTRDNIKMYSIIERLQNDDTYVENIARQDFGMIRIDELIFKFASDLK